MSRLVLAKPVAFAETYEEFLALLRTKGLSIKGLDEKRRKELRAMMHYLHVVRGVSLSDIAKMIGNKTSGYTSWLCKQLGVEARPFEEARLRGIREKRRKYERRPFDGTDEDKAYILGLKRGDLSASRPWKDVVRVSTSTTHPAMAELFRNTFESFGHVYQHPRYKEEMATYEWNLSVILDDSFSFLLADPNEALEWVKLRASTLLAFLAGLLDSDGSILVTRDGRGSATLFLDYYGSDKILLEWVKTRLLDLGYSSSLRRNKPKGYATKKYGIVHRTDYWQLSTYGIERVKKLLLRLPILHPEKVQRRNIALSVSEGTPFSKVEPVVQQLKTKIREDVNQFVTLAGREFLRTHPAKAE